MKVTHDIHTHTLLSACCFDPEATVAAYVNKAAELGHRFPGIRVDILRKQGHLQLLDGITLIMTDKSKFHIAPF